MMGSGSVMEWAERVFGVLNSGWMACGYFLFIDAHVIVCCLVRKE